MSKESLRSVRGPIQEVPVLQKPGRHTLLRKLRFPDGEGLNTDRRLFIDRKTLQQLLDCAGSSPMGRAVIHGVTVEVEQYITDKGHVYECWSFSGQAVPEATHRDLQISENVGMIRNRVDAEEG